MQMMVRKTVASAGDGMEFVLSDATPDRFGDVIEADGWNLANFKKNPIALFGHDGDFPIGNWRDVRVDGERLIGSLELMSPVSERLREIHTAVDAGVLRAVSVGFRPIQSEPIEGTHGTRFLKTELIECSLVAVPANPNALQLAKSLNLSNDTLNLIFGKSAFDGRGMGRGRPGEPAETPPIHRTRPMDTEQFPVLIEKAQDRVVALTDQLSAQITRQNDLPEDDETIAEVTTLTAELSRRLGQARAHLTSLKDAEELLGAAAEPVVAAPGRGMVPSAGRPMFRKAVKEAEPIDYLCRTLAAEMVVYTSRNKITVPELLQRYHQSDYERTFAFTDFVMRAATVPATTTMASWAAELTQRLNYDLLDLLPKQNIFGPLSSMGDRFNFGRNGSISLPARNPTPSIGGSFVGEGAPIPVRQAAFTAATLTPKKTAVITTWTREIDEHSVPQIEQVLRKAIADDNAAGLDSVLVDANPATTIRPAGLLNGATSQTPTAGGGFNALVGDLKKMVRFLSDANSLRNPAWIMNPGDAAAAGLVQNAGGNFAFRDEINANTLLGYRLITSPTQPAGTVIFLDAADFFSANGDVPRFAISDQATLHMEDTTPAQISTPGAPNVVAAPVRNMFQTDSLALRMTLDVNWTMRRPGLVTFTSGITWG